VKKCAENFDNQPQSTIFALAFALVMQVTDWLSGGLPMARVEKESRNK
jgi:hypothetical protein